MNIPIIYEDDDLLIIDKPAGITVNRAETTKHEITIQDWAETKLKISSEELKVEEGNDFYNRGGRSEEHTSELQSQR